jgi:hypothetical protein
MTDPGILSLAGLGIALGLRHGIDWDHLAAITDITSATVTTDGTTRESTDSLSSLARAAASAPQAGMLAIAAAPGLGESRAARVHYDGMTGVDTRRQEAWHGFFLATMYALGHASLVVALGLLAIWFGTLLPHWIDPLMGRIVGITLLFLGVWIIYSLVRYGRDFRLQSRWMVLIALELPSASVSCTASVPRRDLRRSCSPARSGPRPRPPEPRCSSSLLLACSCPTP